jgi:hypothetical protein
VEKSVDKITSPFVAQRSPLSFMKKKMAWAAFRG